MAITVEEAADLLATTQRELGKGKWTDIAADLQEYVGFQQIFKKKRVGFQSGTSIQWDAMVDLTRSVENVGLYHTATYSVGDVMKQLNVPWRHTHANYSFDRTEIDLNRSPARIVNLMKIRRADMQLSLAEHIENDWWGKPSSATDEVTPYGVDTWLVRDPVEGFTGGNPAGFPSGVGGLDSSVYTRWRNWSAQYTNMTKTDLVRKWRKAATHTRFMSPVDMNTFNTGDNYGYYTNYNVLGTLEEILESQNESLGNDIASKDGATLFRRRPVQWVPQLDSDTANPVYGINWGVFKAVFLNGWFLEESAPYKAPNQPRVMRVDVDLTYNYCCRDRRRNFVLYQ